MSTNKHPLRDYGLGDPTPFVVGPPRIKHYVDGQTCPNCKGATVYVINVSVTHPLLKGNTGIGEYMGCAACPWASPMVMAATGAQKEEGHAPADETHGR